LLRYKRIKIISDTGTPRSDDRGVLFSEKFPRPAGERVRVREIIDNTYFKAYHERAL